MRRTLNAVLAAFLLLPPAAVSAQTASEATAKRVEEAIRTYGPDRWSQPGLLSVTPDGDGYRLVFDMARGIEARIAPWKVKEATPLEFRLNEQAAGRWAFDAGGGLRISTEYLAATRTNGFNLAIASKTIRGVFDPAVLFPRTMEIGLDDAVLTVRSAQESIRFAMKDYRLVSATKDLAEGMGDVDADFAAHDVSATFGAFPNPEIRLSAARIEGTYRLGQFDLAGVGALTRFWQVTAAGKDASKLTDAEREQLRAILARHAPFVDDISGSLVASDLSMSQAGKAFSVKKLDWHSRWEGMGGRVAMVVGARVENVAVDPGVWPKALEAILPDAAAFNIRSSGFDMAAMWKETAELRTPEEQARLPKDEFMKSLLPDGRMTMEITDSFIRSGFYDLSVSGRFHMIPDEKKEQVTGTLTVTARDLDATVRYLQENAQAVPLFGRAAFFALMMKGLGKAQPDGSIVWDVRFEESGKITVNGQPLPR